MKQMLHSFLSFLLAGAVLLLGVSPEAFHHHEEHKHHCEETHTPGEVDACHIRIFHEGGSAACLNHQHLLNGLEECAFCQLHLPHYQVLQFIENAASEIHFASMLATTEIAAATTQQQKTQNPNRGPPVLV